LSAGLRLVFDENTPRVVAQAVRLIAEAEALGTADRVEVLHALDVIAKGTRDVTLLHAIAGGSQAKVGLVTADKAMRTRHHERAAFKATGCIGIVLRGDWNHASMWDRARLTLAWWPVWLETVRQSAPGAMWNCPWSGRPKPLRSY
jgi:hypothetical protein